MSVNTAVVISGGACEARRHITALGIYFLATYCKRALPLSKRSIKYPLRDGKQKSSS